MRKILRHLTQHEVREAREEADREFADLERFVNGGDRRKRERRRSGDRRQ